MKWDMNINKRRLSTDMFILHANIYETHDFAEKRSNSLFLV